MNMLDIDIYAYERIPVFEDVFDTASPFSFFIFWKVGSIYLIQRV